MSRARWTCRPLWIAVKQWRKHAAFSKCATLAAKARNPPLLKLAAAAVRYKLSPNPNQVEWPRARSILYGVHGHINDQRIFAATATETVANVISESFAAECGLQISSLTTRQRLSMPDGGEVQPVGITAADWTFKGERASRVSVDFLVLRSTSRPVILGDEVLRRTGTIGVNWRRLRLAPTAAENFSCIHMLGDRTNTIAGTIGWVPVYAVAATGSEVNLISQDFVEKHWSMRLKARSLGDDHSVKLIDGRTFPIERTVVFRWRYGSEYHGWPAEFVVFPGLPYDVVLGQQLLYGSGAFFNYAGYFRKERPTTTTAGLLGAPFLRSFCRHKAGELPLKHGLPRRTSSQTSIPGY